jgi:LmbE family N-acetylglucosaminyl deacetylase
LGSAASLAGLRTAEPAAAARVLGIAEVELADRPAGGPHRVPPPELRATGRRAPVAHHADGLLVFDLTGVTGHLDHRDARLTALAPAAAVDLPVLDGAARRPAARLHASHAGSPVLWRLLVLLADSEHLLWLPARSPVSPPCGGRPATPEPVA